MKVINHTRNQVKDNWQSTKTVTKNVAEFVDATCLGIVSGFAIYTAQRTTERNLWEWVLLFSGVAIAFQAFLLLVKHFKKEG